MGLTERQIKAVNVNGDNELSVDDAQNILKYYTQKTVAGKDITWEDILGKKQLPPSGSRRFLYEAGRNLPDGETEPLIRQHHKNTGQRLGYRMIKGDALCRRASPLFSDQEVLLCDGVCNHFTNSVREVCNNRRKDAIRPSEKIFF